MSSRLVEIEARHLMQPPRLTGRRLVAQTGSESMTSGREANVPQGAGGEKSLARSPSRPLAGRSLRLPSFAKMYRSLRIMSFRIISYYGPDLPVGAPVLLSGHVFSSFLWLLRPSLVGVSELLDCRLSRFIGGVGFGQVTGRQWPRFSSAILRVRSNSAR
jgi:hypothetical protein